jgi:hypothetical protein
MAAGDSWRTPPATMVGPELPDGHIGRDHCLAADQSEALLHRGRGGSLVCFCSIEHYTTCCATTPGEIRYFRSVLGASGRGAVA